MSDKSYTAKDVILSVAPYSAGNYESPREVERFETPLHVHGDIWIGELDRDFADEILADCSPRGKRYNGFPGYAFFRDYPPAERPYEPEFDPDGRLRISVYLSRLVYPTGIGLEASARVRYARGERSINPYIHLEQNSFGFVAHPNDNWLLPSDIPAMSALLRAYHDGKPHTRVARGLWFYEAAFRQAYVDLRWAFLVTALEALVHIRKERLADGKGKAGTTQVFVDRLLHFSTLDPELAISEQKLRDFYDERSTVAHGQVFSKLDPRLRELYDDLEEFSRRVLRKAVLEPGFAACFASDKQVQATLPLRPRAPSPPKTAPSSRASPSKPKPSRRKPGR